MGVENFIQETFLSHLFFGKYKYLPSIILTLGKYIVSQEIRPVPTKPVDVSRGEIPKFATFYHGNYQVREGEKRIFKRQSPLGG